MSAEERWLKWSAKNAMEHGGVPWYRRGYASFDIPLGTEPGEFFTPDDPQAALREARYLSLYLCYHCASPVFLLTRGPREIHDACYNGLNLYPDGPHFTLDLAAARVIPGEKGEVPAEAAMTRAATAPWWAPLGVGEKPAELARRDFLTDAQWATLVDDAAAMRAARERELMTFLAQERRQHGFVSCDSLRVERVESDGEEKLQPPRHLCCHQKYRGVALGFVASCSACLNVPVQIAHFLSATDGQPVQLHSSRGYVILGSGTVWRRRTHYSRRPGDKLRILTVLLCALRYEREHARRYALEHGGALPPEHGVRLPPELWELVLGFLPVDVVLWQYNQGTRYR